MVGCNEMAGINSHGVNGTGSSELYIYAKELERVYNTYSQRMQKYALAHSSDCF